MDASSQGISQLNVLVAFSGGTLIAALVLLVKISRFLSRMELKTDILWTDYTHRRGLAQFEANDLADNEG